MHPVSYHMHLLAVLLLCSLRLSRQIVDLTVPALCALGTYFYVFFWTSWSLMNGCDELFYDWIWTSWFIGRSRFNLPEPNPLTHIFEPVRPTQGPVYEPTRFLCLSPIFSTVLLNTPLFSIITPFSFKNLFSLCFLSFKNIFALY